VGLNIKTHSPINSNVFHIYTGKNIMKKAKNISNIQIVKNYLDGERPVLQVGYSGEAEDNKPREIGEIWTDSKGRTWRKTEYGKSSVTPVMDLINAENKKTCKCCKADIRWGSPQDEKIYNKTQMCFDCLIEHETNIRLKGKWKEYETRKVFENQLAYVSDVKQKIKDSLEYTKKTRVLTFVNSNGRVEEWEDNRRDDLLKDLKKDHVKCLKTIKKLEGEIKKLDEALNECL
jgi:hypothetical protein